MKTQSISHLLYYPITFYARSSPSDSYLSFPRSVLSILSLLVAWNHRYADNHKWRAEKRVETGRERAEREGGRDIEGWQEGTCAGFVRQRGSWFEWSYATWLEILSNLRLHITWQQRCARLQIEPASVAGRSRESEDDYKRWYERFHERCNYVFVGILRVYISSTCDFSNCDPRRSRAKQEFVSSFFALQGSSPSKRVPLWSALHSVPSTPSIIFWSRICSILERTGARCLEPTSRTWLETLVSLRLYEASKVGRARKRERENARTCGSWILGPMKTTMRKALCCGNSAAETKKRIGEHRFRRRNFPSQPSVRASSSHSLWIPEFRARVVGTQPWAALSGHPRIYRIHHDEFRGIRCLDGFYSVVPSWKRIRS